LITLLSNTPFLLSLLISKPPPILTAYPQVNVYFPPLFFFSLTKTNSSNVRHAAARTTNDFYFYILNTNNVYYRNHLHHHYILLFLYSSNTKNVHDSSSVPNLSLSPTHSQPFIPTISTNIPTLFFAHLTNRSYNWVNHGER